MPELRITPQAERGKGGCERPCPSVGEASEGGSASDRRGAGGKVGKDVRWEIHQRVGETTETLRETLQNERCTGEWERCRRVRQMPESVGERPEVGRNAGGWAGK